VGRPRRGRLPDRHPAEEEHPARRRRRAAAAAGSDLLYDRIGRLPERLTTTRKNPFADPVREIGVALQDGKALRVVTNEPRRARPGDSPTSTSAAGPSNSSSDGSSRP